MSITIATQILEAVKVLFGLKAELLSAKQARRVRLSDLLTNIAICLEGAASEIRAGRYPAGRCGELLEYSKELPSAMGEELGLEKSASISETLRSSYRVEELFATRGTAPGDAEIAKLDEAAGMLRAISNIVRV